MEATASDTANDTASGTASDTDSFHISRSILDKGDTDLKNILTLSKKNDLPAGNVPCYMTLREI